MDNAWLTFAFSLELNGTIPSLSSGVHVAFVCTVFFFHGVNKGCFDFLMKLDIIHLFVFIHEQRAVILLHRKLVYTMKV